MTLHRSSGEWRLGLVLALITVLLWGVLPIPLKVVLQAADVYTVTWFRFLLSFGLLTVYLGIRQQLPSWQTLRSLRLDLLTIATVSLAVNYLFFLKGLNATSPSNAQVIIQLAPVLMGMGGLFVFKERYHLRQWLGLSVLAFGMTLFFNDQLQVLAGASAAYLLGSFWLLLAAIVWAAYALAQKQLLQQLSSPGIMWLIYGGSALLFTPLAAPTALFNLTGFQWTMLIFSAFNTLLAYGAFAEALDRWDASRVSAVLSLTPIITMGAVFMISGLFPAMLTADAMTWLGLMGAMLVVSGSASIALGK
ncbi:DMT family transporter [Thermocoleostomius sinensis]|uniref:DMT family transporter n=1 Tax=Thermocoleostomius sinensis A174 TaxID=2016057 RepID=A0A9E9C8T0_9CYAN|nr:DMT family transporter [Thermocoleostomius sinensis]WAL60633.1 DMT family transporter [Thermocoleostomius sinensis A174]